MPESRLDLEERGGDGTVEVLGIINSLTESEGMGSRTYKTCVIIQCQCVLSC